MEYWKALGIGVMLIVLCEGCGPRMDKQPSVKAYHQYVAPMPANTVPTTGKLGTNALEQSRLARSPLPATPENVYAGEKYYANYCAFCHGPQGKGDGPVATVLTPKVSDLTSPSVTSLDDGQLYGRMLHGVGHDPVMEQTVLPDSRWQIVMYVRSLQGKVKP